MRILALEFSATLRSVAAAEGDRVLARARERAPRECGPVGLIREVLGAAGWEPGGVDVVAVGLGPGSYHGVRVAIALAQGWVLGRGVRVVGVDSSLAVALAVHGEGTRGPLAVAIDAQRGEFYLAGYVLDDVGARLDAPLRLADVGQVRVFADERGLVVGPDAVPGEPRWRPVFPDAGAVARVAAGCDDFHDVAALEPVYLREAQFVKRGLPGAAQAGRTASR